MGQDVQQVFIFATDTGMRHDEIFNLELKDIFSRHGISKLTLIQNGSCKDLYLPLNALTFLSNSEARCTSVHCHLNDKAFQLTLDTHMVNVRANDLRFHYFLNEGSVGSWEKTSIVEVAVKSGHQD